MGARMAAGELSARRPVATRPALWFAMRMIPERQFYFLRHGQTDWNLGGRYQGISDVPLNATGIAQANAAAARLRSCGIDRIIASPLIRALKTAAIVAEAASVPIHVEPALRERGFGSFEGLVVREMKARHGIAPEMNSRSIMPADADPWDEILTRVPPAIAGWLARHPGETLLFVAHGGVFDAIHNHCIGPRSGPESLHAAPYCVRPGKRRLGHRSCRLIGAAFGDRRAGPSPRMPATGKVCPHSPDYRCISPEHGSGARIGWKPATPDIGPFPTRRARAWR